MSQNESEIVKQDEPTDDALYGAQIEEADEWDREEDDWGDMVNEGDDEG
jgi:hypothetical protein